MTEVEELPEHPEEQPAHTLHPDAFDSDGRCTHQHIYHDESQSFLRRCHCAEKRYGVCAFCNDIIDLGRSEIRWPYFCNECHRPACVKCANFHKRLDDNPTKIICYKCDTTPSARRSWTVMYRATHITRDRAQINTLYPHPCLFSVRDDAACGALDYLPVVCPTTLTADARDQLAAEMRERFSGWFNTKELRTGSEVFKLEVGLFPLHAPGTELFLPPSQ